MIMSDEARKKVRKHVLAHKEKPIEEQARVASIVAFTTYMKDHVSMEDYEFILALNKFAENLERKIKKDAKT